MANEPEEERPGEDEGGPVKTFLEHLEDLRWVLLKSAVAISVGMLLCLIAGNYVVGFLKWPLERARATYRADDFVVNVVSGTNRVLTFHPDKAQREAMGLTNQFSIIRADFKPSTNGNLELALKLETGPEADAMAGKIHVDLNTFSPVGGFFVAFKVAIYGGIGLASPLVLYFVAQFVFPALKIREKHYIHLGMFFAVPLFLTGLAFCYFVLTPVALTASQVYSNWLGFSATVWRAEDYVSFVSKFMLGMGLGFELPVVILVLVKIGILDYGTLKMARRYMIVINLVLGAVLTTPEVITQVLMFIPLQALYELSLGIAWYWEQPDKGKARWRVALVLTVLALMGVGIWAAWKYGWPWLKAYWH